MLLYVLLGIIGLVILAAGVSNLDARRKALQAAAKIKALELNYEEYLQEHLYLDLLDEHQLNVDATQLAKETLHALLPDLKGIIALVNTTVYSEISIPYNANYFPTIVSLTEEYFRQSRKNSTKRLSLEEEQQFKLTALDAMEADIHQRLLRLEL